MRYFFILTTGLMIALWSLSTHAVEWEDRRLFEGRTGSETLRVISSTDLSFFAPIIDDFLAVNPDLNVEYLVAGSSDIFDEFRRSPNDFDLIISSAMDLQLKLVNDGYAHRTESIGYPDWAQWRQSLFGFTLEPASIVINKSAFEDLPVPGSRQEMIEVLRANPDYFRGKLGTYDIRKSGLGYLFATQDARTSDTYWRLMEIMGSLSTRLYCCSGEMIEDLANGTIAISYNVLGSYATARRDLADKIETILPSDFPITMMRTALIAKNSPRIRSAILFLRYLTTARQIDPGLDSFLLPSLQPVSHNEQRSIIALDPGLMIYLDRMKRQTFIKEWESAIIQ